MDPEVKVTRVRGQTRISSKHQVTLSVDALARAGLHPGDVLAIVDVRPGELVLRLVDDPIARHAGTLTGLWEPGDLDALRDEWR
jgi:hypothetical protein